MHNINQKIISIPSFVNKDCDESLIGQFIFEYLQQFSFLKVEKQPIKDGRFNVIARDKYPTKLLWCGHMDTVQMQNGWRTDPLKPTHIDGKLYGLGASDMKSGIASLLATLQEIKKTKGLMLLFYIDEEYDFMGIKRFIEEYKNRISPKYIISGDGKEFSIGTACRGLIEITGVVKGKSAHSSQPKDGVNAIIKTVDSVMLLNDYIQSNYSSKTLSSVCNLAYIQGGSDQRDGKIRSDILLGREGNIIPDLAEFVLEIRPASSLLNATKTVKLLSKFITQYGLTVESLNIRHDLGSWETPKKDLYKFKKMIEKINPTKYLSPEKYGYIDLQLLWATFNKVPCFTFGSGIMGHIPNEYVPVENIIKAEKIYKTILEEITGY